MNLRPYQSAVIDKLWTWFRQNPEGHPVIEACVGAGKSVMIAETCRQALSWPGTRVLMCVASRELCRQNAEKLIVVWPEAPVGIYSAGLKSRQLDNRIVYATIGSVWKRAHELGQIDLLMIDECHNVSAKDQGMYRNLINDLRRYCPNLRVIGWTGTAFHGNGVWLHDAEDALFSDIAARVSMRQLLDLGFLSPLATPKVSTRLSAEGVKMVGGDFMISQLAKAIDKDSLVQQCADELMQIGQDRKRWFAFGATVEHCQHISEALNQRGIPSAVVSASTPHAERDASLAMLKSGKLRCLVNVACLTTGIDVPELDLIALMRNTRSPVLFVQMLGRGMRIAEGKADCLLVDFTDSLEVLGPVDLIKGRPRGVKNSSDAPTKLCQECGAKNPASARECSECGAPFQFEEKPRHGSDVSDAPALSSDFAPRLERVAVSSVAYRFHHGRDGKLPTLRVDYHGPFSRIASEWICIEHSGYARQKAMVWWVQRAPQGLACPDDIDAALLVTDQLRIPSHITVNTRPKYPEITKHEFADDYVHHLTESGTAEIAA